MEMTLDMNAIAFTSLNYDEMMEVDGGASRFAVAVVNIGCSIIAGVVFAGAGALVGAAIGAASCNPAAAVVGAVACGVVGLVGGAVAGYFMADAITSKW